MNSFAFLLHSFINLHFSFHAVIFRNNELANILMYECLMRVVISIGVMEMSVMLEIFDTKKQMRKDPGSGR